LSSKSYLIQPHPVKALPPHTIPHRSSCLPASGGRLSNEERTTDARMVKPVEYLPDNPSVCAGTALLLRLDAHPLSTLSAPLITIARLHVISVWAPNPRASRASPPGIQASPAGAASAGYHRIFAPKTPSKRL